MNLGPPTNRRAGVPLDPESPDAWEAVPGRPHLWRNKVNGRMRYTPPEPIPEPFVFQVADAYDWADFQWPSVA